MKIKKWLNEFSKQILLLVIMLAFIVVFFVMFETHALVKLSPSSGATVIGCLLDFMKATAIVGLVSYAWRQRFKDKLASIKTLEKSTLSDEIKESIVSDNTTNS